MKNWNVLNELQKRKQIAFGSQWESQLGIQVTSKGFNNGEPSTAVCRFWAVFGREINDKTNGGGKNKKTRKATQRIQQFAPPWRRDAIQRHMELYHKERFQTYSGLSASDKNDFFTNIKKNMNDFLTSQSSGGGHTYFVQSSIVHMIGEILVDEKEVGWNKGDDLDY